MYDIFKALWDLYDMTFNINCYRWRGLNFNRCWLDGIEGVDGEVGVLGGVGNAKSLVLKYIGDLLCILGESASLLRLRSATKGALVWYIPPNPSHFIDLSTIEQPSSSRYVE